MSSLKSIAFLNEDDLEALRERLRRISDDQFVAFGKAERYLCRDKLSCVLSPTITGGTRRVA